MKKELDDTISIYWPKRPKKLSVVFTKSEAIEVLNRLKGTHWLVGMLLYGSGLRLSESLELRVKDIDFGYNQNNSQRFERGKRSYYNATSENCSAIKGAFD